jgi:hypothetical protein
MRAHAQVGYIKFMTFDCITFLFQSQAFKYADSNQLFFTCQIRLCQKQMNMCDGVTVSANLAYSRFTFKFSHLSAMANQIKTRLI